jgi:hypothetical protein
VKKIALRYHTELLRKGAPRFQIPVV